MDPSWVLDHFRMVKHQFRYDQNMQYVFEELEKNFRNSFFQVFFFRGFQELFSKIVEKDAKLTKDDFVYHVTRLRNARSWCLDVVSWVR